MKFAELFFCFSGLENQPQEMFQMILLNWATRNRTGRAVMKSGVFIGRRLPFYFFEQHALNEWFFWTRICAVNSPEISERTFFRDPVGFSTICLYFFTKEFWTFADHLMVVFLNSQTEGGPKGCVFFFFLSRRSRPPWLWQIVWNFLCLIMRDA